jgi:hypothetical protein
MKNTRTSPYSCPEERGSRTAFTSGPRGRLSHTHMARNQPAVVLQVARVNRVYSRRTKSAAVDTTPLIRARKTMDEEFVTSSSRQWPHRQRMKRSAALRAATDAYFLVSRGCLARNAPSARRRISFGGPAGQSPQTGQPTETGCQVAAVQTQARQRPNADRVREQERGSAQNERRHSTDLSIYRLRHLWMEKQKVKETVVI